MSSILSVGDLVTYTSLDLESLQRGYGVHYEARASTIVAICYKLANGEVIEARHVTHVQSKSEDPKTLQNGSPG